VPPAALGPARSSLSCLAWFKIVANYWVVKTRPRAPWGDARWPPVPCRRFSRFISGKQQRYSGTAGALRHGIS